MRKTVVLTAMFVLVCAGCIGSSPNAVTPTPTETTTLLNDVDILKIAGENENVREFISEYPQYSYTVVVLALENLTDMAVKYPAVYGNLPQKTLYRVDYTSGSRGVFVIVDADEGKIMRYFRSVGVSL